MKNITIKIGDQDLVSLKQNKYALCVSCRDKDFGYDVIGYARTDYMTNTTIGFADEYQIFCCDSVTNNEVLNLSTNSVDIEFGQKITLNETGLFSAPESGDRGGVITLDNNFGNTHPGYSRKIRCGGSEAFWPVFAAPYASVKGTYTMSPQDVVQIWFEQFAESKTFLKDFLLRKVGIGRSVPKEVELTDGEIQLVYQNGNWQK